MASGSRSPLLNIPCWLDGIPELRFVQHLADLVLRASQRFVHRELTERVTYVFDSGRQETVPRGRFVLSGNWLARHGISTVMIWTWHVVMCVMRRPRGHWLKVSSP